MVRIFPFVLEDLLSFIVGPLLFLIFINDMPSHISAADTILFADDTSLFVKASNEATLQERVTEATEEADKWFRDNKLIVNEKKTVWINFSHIRNKQGTNLTVELGQCKIEKTAHSKFLGVWLDGHLRWEKHIELLNKKLSQYCYLLRMLKYSCNIETVVCSYFAFIHSILRYGIIFWGNTNLAKRSFIIQKRAIRIIKGVAPRESCKNIFKELKITTLPCIYIYESICFLKSHQEHSVLNSQVHRYETRNIYDFHREIHTKSMYQKSVLYQPKILFCKLPKKIKKISKLHTFKKELKKMLISNCFYSIKEYMNHQHSQ